MHWLGQSPYDQSTSQKLIHQAFKSWAFGGRTFHIQTITASNHRRLEEARKKAWPCWHLDLELWVSKTVRKYSPVVLSYLGIVIGYSSPRKPSGLTLSLCKDTFSAWFLCMICQRQRQPGVKAGTTAEPGSLPLIWYYKNFVYYPGNWP
jgi:hypothetical protein